MNIKDLFFNADTLKKYRNLGLLLFRVFLSCFMFSHGIAKLQNFTEMAAVFPDPIGLGSQWSLVLIIFAEAGCSLLIFLGFLTRWATLPLMIGMYVAAFVQHAGDPFAAKELAILYLCMYFVLLILGPGNYSVDAVVQHQFGKNSARRTR